MAHPNYHVCRRCIGKVVALRTRDGRRVQGRVNRVSPAYVFLTPVGRRVQDKKDQRPLANPKHALGTEDTHRARQVLFFHPYIVPLAAIIGLTVVGTAPFWGGGLYGGPYGGGGFFW